MRENIATLTAYATSLIERGIKQDTLEGRFEIILRDQNTVRVRDYFKAHEYDVVIYKNRLFCQTEELAKCEHIGFVLSDPQVIQRAKELGVRLRKKA